MNLTNIVRDDIIKDVIEKTFAKDEKEIVNTEHKIGMALYAKLYSAAERNIAKQLAKGWVAMDKCLRINIGGMDMRFTIKEPVPVKRESGEYGCHRLGAVADSELQAQALELHNMKETLTEKKNLLRGKLKSVLYGVNTYKRLQETWPEGEKYYVKYAPKGDQSLLPAIRVNELNEALGLKSKVV